MQLIKMIYFLEINELFFIAISSPIFWVKTKNSPFKEIKYS